jgi:hypothetical protein
MSEARRNCPRKNCPNSKTMDVWLRMHTNGDYYGHCARCGLSGPASGHSFEAAWALWDKMVSTFVDDGLGCLTQASLGCGAPE